MKRLFLILAVAVACAFTADEASANSDQSGLEKVICDLFNSLCDEDPRASTSATEVADLLGLGEDEIGGLSDGFQEFASLPEGNEGTTGVQHPTPEPSGALLFAAGLGVVCASVRRRRES